MPLPFTYEDLEKRFATVRPWAKDLVGEDTNRCAIVMGYTLKMAPDKSKGDANLTHLVGKEQEIANAKAVVDGPVGRSYPDLFFIRAADLLPRVRQAYGNPDVEGEGKVVWPQVHGRKGVLYVENCYPIGRDKTWAKVTLGIYEPNSGDHWDLFDGLKMVALGYWVSNTSHPGKMYFWVAK
ncbi:hypothetical protein LPC08_09060 [Roseomonas sp. OT10]|uniref:hypothetical protein n=1 Tax=Roseomonas cutis TaxID=2897332 RepID=UPI001E5869B5|nr:hypothetical protein [Roseomonas sp. OT10]UFN50739.1 hypothetical protein LPC08_09060 [Roseomonas sp. OT10]